MSLSLYTEGFEPWVVMASTLSWQFSRGAHNRVARNLGPVSDLMDA